MLHGILRCRWRTTAVGATSIALLSCGLALAEDQDSDDAHQLRTASPIKHVIVLIGENWSFDSIYATYKPKYGQKVGNLLSRGIVREDGTAGPNFSRSMQFQINQPYPVTYFIDSHKTAGKTAYVKAPGAPSFPPPNTAYVPSAPQLGRRASGELKARPVRGDAGEHP